LKISLSLTCSQIWLKSSSCGVSPVRLLLAHEIEKDKNSGDERGAVCLFQKRKKEKGKREKRKYSHGGSSPLVCLRKMEKKKEKGKRKKS
jgi:hypothetical protein